MTQITQMTTDLLFSSMYEAKKEICGHLFNLCRLCAMIRAKWISSSKPRPFVHKSPTFG